MSKSKRTELSDVLYLFTTREEDPISFEYEVECTTFKAVSITLNFEGSENFAIEGSKSMKMTATIRPFHRVRIGKIYLISDDKRASLKMGCEWTMLEPSAEESAAYIQNHLLKMQPILKEATVLPFPPAEADPTDTQVHTICKTYGKKFIDKDFPPTISSIFKADTKLSPGEMSGAEVTKRTCIEWKRASDFMAGDYHVFEGGIEPGDIRQGANMLIC